MMRKFVLFGPPGSGKGTLAEYMSKKLDIKHYSTGQMLRKEVASKTDLGCAIQSTIESGSLVSDEMMNDLVSSHLEEEYILDGYPRTVEQVDHLIQLNPPNCIIFIDVNIEAAVGRLTNRAKEQGRKDDDADVIQKRIKLYQDETKPVLSYWLEMHPAQVFWPIDGNVSIDDVRKQFDEGKWSF